MYADLFREQSMDLTWNKLVVLILSKVSVIFVYEALRNIYLNANTIWMLLYVTNFYLFISLLSAWGIEPHVRHNYVGNIACNCMLLRCRGLRIPRRSTEAVLCLSIRSPSSRIATHRLACNKLRALSAFLVSVKHHYDFTLIDYIR
jgi:hypothetical protein